ncbi:MAG: TniB family NTP-binding protein [Promethearchaeota archaeon]
MMRFSHLNESTISFMEKPIEAKIQWIVDDHFVYYEKAKRCLEQLDWIYEQSIYIKDDDFPSDLEGLTIIGDSGAGKTSIVKEFIRLHSVEHHASYEAYPVAYAMLKDSITGLKGLYSSLLSAFNHPFADPDSFKYKKVTIDQLEEVLVHTLKNTKTLVFFIDEFQHASGRSQQAILNQLKRTMLVSRVPFIPTGTPDVKKVLQLDLQLADRCPIKNYTELTNWEFDNEFRRFLAGYEKFLPFTEPSNLSSRLMAELIWNRVKFQIKGTIITNLRHLVRYLKKVAVRSLRMGNECITEEIINDTSY